MDIMHSLIWCFWAVLLFFPISGWSQVVDSLHSKRFENFFISDCPRDTIIETVGIDDACILYSNEYKLRRIKKGRVKWTIDLSDVSDIYTLCMFIRPSTNSKKKYIFILYYTGDWEEVARKIIVYPTGKVLATFD